VQVKDVARVGFPARRAAQDERDLAVRLGVLGEVVVDDQHVAPGVHEFLTHGAARIGCDVAQGGGSEAFAATIVV